jgi:hypothetical protein
VSNPKPSVTLTVDLVELRQLFAGGNRCRGGVPDDANPLDFALDIIEHAAMELYTLHDALRGTEDRTEELASHMWRLSVQLTAGIELVYALQKATVSP